MAMDMAWAKLVGQVAQGYGYRYGSLPLKRCLSTLSERIFDSRVDRGTPSLAAAPVGPDTRPLLAASAASTRDRS